MDGCTPGEARRAGVGDAAEVIRLRQAMFEAMASTGVAALPHDAANKNWHAGGIREIQRQLAEGRSAAYVVDAVQSGPPQTSPLPPIIACAVSSLEQRLPGPGFPTGLSGSMHTVFVEPEYRRQGLARQVVTAALGWLKDCGVETVDLRATFEAERLYRSLGFTEPRSVALRWLSPVTNTSDA